MYICIYSTYLYIYDWNGETGGNDCATDNKQLNDQRQRLSLVQPSVGIRTPSGGSPGLCDSIWLQQQMLKELLK